MQSSDLNIVNQLLMEIERIGVMNARILTEKNERSENIGTLREMVVSSPLNAKLHILNWKKVIATDSLGEVLAELNLSSGILNRLLEYPHVGQVKKEEWELLSANNEFLTEYLEQNEGAIESRWFLPLTLQAINLGGKFNDKLDYIVINLERNNLPSKNKQILKDHYLTMKILSLVTEQKISYNLFTPLAEIYEKNHEKQAFEDVCSLLVAYPEAIETYMDLQLFNAGVRKVSKYLSKVQMLQLREKLGSEFVSVLKEIGEKVKVELTEKAVNHLFHKDGNVLDVLFHPYGEVVKNTTERAYNRQSVGHRCIFDDIVEFVQYLALNKKKGFFRLLEETDFNIAGVPTYSMLIDRRFYKLVNVNTLNKEALKRLSEKPISNNHFEEMDGQMTFQEFEFLNEASKLHADLFPMMEEMKVDEKIRILGMLPGMTFNSAYLIPYEEFKTTLLKAMQEKRFQEFTKFMEMYRVSKKSALILHLFYDQWKSVIQEVKSDQDVELLMMYKRYDGESLLNMKERLYKNLPLIQKFKEFLGASEEFIKTNQANFYRFYERGLMNAVVRYKDTLVEKQAFNLRLLCKAEIADKLKDVKFRDEDFSKEIGITPSHEQREGWKNDLSITEKRFDIFESNDFYDLFNFGVIPTSTCQAWDTGSYKHCLLSIFDLNKKLIVVKEGDKVVARAILRLTKTKTQQSAESELGFVDIEKEFISDSPTNVDTADEKIVMFLERFYTTHTGKARAQMIRAVMALAEMKAKDMKVDLLYARTYNSERPYAEEVTVPIYISRSKNGNQYLDSLGGEANEEGGGKYHQAKILRLN